MKLLISYKLSISLSDKTVNHNVVEYEKNIQTELLL